MNNRVNYTLIGAIVLVGLALMAGFIFWLTKPTAEDNIKIYSICFSESVLGLNIDAPVKYRGLHVGKVTTIRVSPYNEEQVEVLVSILKTTPIKELTVATLTAQGITGLSYINLSKSKTDVIHKLTNPSTEYDSIHTQASFFNNLENSIDSVSTGLNTTLERTNAILNEENQKKISQILDKSASFMNKLDTLLDDKTIKHLQTTTKNTEELSVKLNAITPNINSFIDKSAVWEDSIANSFNSIMNSYTGIHGSMMEIKRAVSSGEFNVKDISKDIVPVLNSTLGQMNELFIKVDETLDQYNRSPSDILFKEETIRKGPGE